MSTIIFGPPSPRDDADSGRIVRRLKRDHNGRAMPLSHRVRARLRDEFAHRKISQRKLADRLTKATGEVYTQSKVHKILTGQVQLLVDDLERLADLLGWTVVETVRDQGREFVADLTPSELKLLTLLRENPPVLAIVQAMTDEFSRRQPQRKPGRRTVRERMATRED